MRASTSEESAIIGRPISGHRDDQGSRRSPNSWGGLKWLFAFLKLCRYWYRSRLFRRPYYYRNSIPREIRDDPRSGCPPKSQKTLDWSGNCCPPRDAHPQRCFYGLYVILRLLSHDLSFSVLCPNLFFGTKTRIQTRPLGVLCNRAKIQK